jgi:hypothetical protein
LPRFQTQAIDAIIKRSQQSNDISLVNSYDSTSNHSASSSINNNSNTMPSWMMPTNKVAGAQSTILPNAILNNTPKLYTPTHVSHSRSKSVPYNFLSKIDNNSNIDQLDDEPSDLLDNPESRRSTNHSSHVSMDADSLQKMVDTGQSLLLTQSFQPNFIDGDDNDDDDDDTDDEPNINKTANSDDGSNRSSNNSSTSCRMKQPSNNYNPYLTATTATNTNPFETDDSSSTTPTQTPTILPQTTAKSSTLFHQTLNTCMNSVHIPPPPVPPQSTKPAYPKYARRTLF